MVAEAVLLVREKRDGGCAVIVIGLILAWVFLASGSTFGFGVGLTIAGVGIVLWVDSLPPRGSS